MKGNIESIKLIFRHALGVGVTNNIINILSGKTFNDKERSTSSASYFSNNP